MYAVEAPQVAPNVGGLLDVANVIENDPDHGRITDQGPVYENRLMCGASREVPDAGTEKTFDQRELVEGEVFKVYRGLEESLFIADHGDAETDLKAAFEAGASFAVETAVQRLLLNPTAVDLTPADGITDPRFAVGLLEQYAATHYAGLPVIHTNKLGAILVPELRDRDGKLYTVNGTPVANGGGYSSTGPGAVEAGPSQVWLYISGQVNIWKGTPEIIAARALEQNRHHTLAEATYAATVECFSAAVLLGAAPAGP